MRRILGALVLAVLIIGLWEFSRSATWFLFSKRSVTFYDPNPAHLWNRLHSVLFIREDLPDTARVPDALDPPLWPNSKYLLSNPSHERVLKILDEFLQSHGEKLIQDPVKRAILTRDLWAVFDWSVERDTERPGEPAYEKEKLELQSRLAEVVRRLALTPEEIRSLPSSYRQALASGQFGKDYDPEHRDHPFLPPDLFEPRSPWVELFSQGPDFASEEIAPEHAHAFSRSTFMVFLRLPGGRKATFDYVRTLWEFPEPYLPRPEKFTVQMDQTVMNRELPQFPAGTEVALVRQLVLFDNHGELQGTPITESVQIRVYRSVAPVRQDNGRSRESEIEASGQDFYQIVLSRPQLFAGHSGGLRATGRQEREFAMFNSFGADEGSPAQHVRLDQYSPVLEQCFECHSRPGINSLNSRQHLLRPYYLQHDYPENTLPSGNEWWVDESGAYEKRKRYDWGLLNGYWNSSGGK
jgi:hypothetical protein